jgi:hypothetical protein
MSSENPYLKPIKGHWRRLAGIRWQAPFVPQAVMALALMVVLFLLALLYLTIGIAAQICALCVELIADAQPLLRTAPPVEKSAYLVATVVYCLVFVPFWLVQTPVLLLGWAVNRLAEPARPGENRRMFGRRDYVASGLSDQRR